MWVRVTLDKVVRRGFSEEMTFQVRLPNEKVPGM